MGREFDPSDVIEISNDFIEEELDLTLDDLIDEQIHLLEEKEKASEKMREIIREIEELPQDHYWDDVTNRKS